MADGFAVLAGAGITVAGAVNSTTIGGDIGSFPTLAITGLGNVVLHGVNHGGDATTQSAKADLVTAYDDAAGRTPTVFYGSANQDLGGLTLGPGVYHDTTSFGITGTLTLDGGPNDVWIFQAGSTLGTAAGNSQVLLINGAQAKNVFWQVGSSATLGTGTLFAGTILALTDITVTTGATVAGRLLARNGAVTLDSNVVGKPAAPPTAARLDYFHAVVAGHGLVALSWGTLVEVQTLGFRIDRSLADGTWERVTAAMIVASGSDLRPHHYDTQDLAAPMRAGLRYRLLEVTINGSEQVLAVATLKTAQRLDIQREGTRLSLRTRGLANGTAVVQSATTLPGPWDEVAHLRLAQDGTAAMPFGVSSSGPARFYRALSDWGEQTESPRMAPCQAGVQGR